MTENIVDNLREVIRVFTLPSAVNHMGTPLLDKTKAKVVLVKREQHAPCLTDPPGYTLYTETHTIKKGETLKIIGYTKEGI